LICHFLASPVLEDNEITAKPKKTIVEAVQGNFVVQERSEKNSSTLFDVIVW
jgi:hypothetical protein